MHTGCTQDEHGTVHIMYDVMQSFFCQERRKRSVGKSRYSLTETHADYRSSRRLPELTPSHGSRNIHNAPLFACHRPQQSTVHASIIKLGNFTLVIPLNYASFTSVSIILRRYLITKQRTNKVPTTHSLTTKDSPAQPSPYSSSLRSPLSAMPIFCWVVSTPTLNWRAAQS